MNPDNGEILASEWTTNEVGDLSLVRPLLDPMPGEIASILADGAYDGEPVYRVARPIVMDVPRFPKCLL